MPHIRISNQSNEQHDYPQPLIGHGTRIFLDGTELVGTRDIKLHFPIDGLVTCDIEMLATEGFVFEADVAVNVHLVVPEGCRILETTSSKGRSFTVVGRP